MNAKSLSKTETVGPDRELKTLLKAWIAAVRRFSDLSEDWDNCWWYNERAAVGSLAGAAWSMKNWTALEEYGKAKKAKDPMGTPGAKKFRNGRCDLFIMSRRTTFTFEAKLARQPIGTQENNSRHTYAKMKAAWEDIGFVIPHHSERRFAATFVVPSIPMDQIRKSAERGIDKENLTEAIQTWLLDMGDFSRKGSKPPAYAYIFPSLGNPGFTMGERHYPGVVLVLEERFGVR